MGGGDMGLSAKQDRILSFIREFFADNSRPPTIREIGRAVHISSTSVVNYNLNILQEKGFIRRDREVSRGVKLVEREVAANAAALGGALVRVPLWGRIMAGQPVPGPDSAPMGVEESISLTRDIVHESGPIYALQVKGDSMIDALINDGDIVIMKPETEPRNGDLVAAWLIAEKETTLKRFYREDRGKVRLQPANPTIDPIYVDASNLQIQGKVIAVIRQV
jgi:repressor LexA